MDPIEVSLNLMEKRKILAVVGNQPSDSQS
jgi:hypothetical protein